MRMMEECVSTVMVIKCVSNASAMLGPSKERMRVMAMKYVGNVSEVRSGRARVMRMMMRCIGNVSATLRPSERTVRVMMKCAATRAWCSGRARSRCA